MRPQHSADANGSQACSSGSHSQTLFLADAPRAHWPIRIPCLCPPHGSDKVPPTWQQYKPNACLSISAQCANALAPLSVCAIQTHTTHAQHHKHTRAWLAPASCSAGRLRERVMPLVVMAMVSSLGRAFSCWHKLTRSGRSVGSPPVSRTLFTPASTNSRVCVRAHATRTHSHTWACIHGARGVTYTWAPCTWAQARHAPGNVGQQAWGKGLVHAGDDMRSMEDGCSGHSDAGRCAEALSARRLPRLAAVTCCAALWRGHSSPERGVLWLAGQLPQGFMFGPATFWPYLGATAGRAASGHTQP